MQQRRISRGRRTRKSVLPLPVLEHAKTTVLNSLTSPDAQRGHRHAIDEFGAAFGVQQSRGATSSSPTSANE